MALVFNEWESQMKKHVYSLLAASFVSVAAFTPSVHAQTFPPPVSFESAPGTAVFSRGMVGVGPFVNVVNDLPRRTSSPGDSWWYSGYFISQGQKIGYLYHLLLLPTPAGAMLAQSLQITNSTTGAHYSDSKLYPMDQVTLSATELNVVTPTSSLKGTLDDMSIVANTPVAKLDLHLRAVSPAIFNGGPGFFPMLGQATYEYGVPLMATTGSVAFDNKTHSVQGGSTWFDRQWGVAAAAGPPPSFDTLKWSWFGINLSNGEALSVWSFYDQAIGKDRQFANVLHTDGSQSVVVVEATASTTKKWQSPATNKIYPVSWTVRIPQFDTKLTVTATPENQEIVTPILGGSYYQGVSNVTGTYKGRPAAGVARMELLGAWK